MRTKDCLNLTKNNFRIIVGILTDHCGSVVDFGVEMDFLLTGHGSLNEFVFKRNLACSQDCVLCGADLEDWLHVLCGCLAYHAIRDLDDMGVHVVNGIFDVSQCLASSGPLKCANEFARAAF